MYKLCFVGVGSIATRHIKNLKEIYGNNISIDILRSGNGKNLKETVIKCIDNIYTDYLQLPSDYDVIFITNPTKKHYDTLKMLHNYANHFFIEKPVFETGNEIIEQLNLRTESCYYVACPLRYTKVIQYLKNNIDFSKVYSMRCISSSYLPEWRPGIDYRETYSAKKELGGGVSIDLIHEWDYICFLIGFPKEICHYICKVSNLEVDSDDIAIYMGKYEDKVVEIHLDYFGRVPIRKIELFMEDDTIEADLIDEKIIFKKSNIILDMQEDRDEYQIKELEHFFDIIEGKCVNDNTVECALKTLQLATGNFGMGT